MRVFLENISREWKNKVPVIRHAYSYHNAKYWLRRVMIYGNREVAAVVGYILGTPPILFLAIILAGISVTVAMSSPYATILQVLGIFAELIVGFISLLIAAAIFISTLRRQSDDKSIAEDLKFKAALQKNKNTIINSYEKYCAKLNSDERLTVFKATPADSVIDYTDYFTYKEWHQKNLQTLDSEGMAQYFKYVQYPASIVTYMGYSRSYLITEALSVIKIYLDADLRATKAHKRAVEDLFDSARTYQTAGVRGYYIPVEFVGQRLYRVVMFSLVALFLFVIALVFGGWQKDVFPFIDMHIMTVAGCLAIFSMAMASVAIVRYVVMFLNYLRDSSTYQASLLPPVYVHEPDSAMWQPSGGEPLG